MFQPFIEDAIRLADSDQIELPAIQRSVRNSTGLEVPADVVKSLLRRASRKKLLTRKGGRYFRAEPLAEDVELRERIKDLEREHQELATRLREFAAQRGDLLPTDGDALAALTDFLDANHIGIVLGQTPRTAHQEIGSRLHQTVAAFVTKIVEDDGPAYALLEGVVQGLIVQNALLLRDIPATKRHLSGLTVFLDTGVLLRALGYAGRVEQQVTVEALKLIQAAGARLRAFEGTLNEVETILQVYERGLASHAGVRNLRSTPLTHHFLHSRTTPADIRQEIALLKQSLDRLGIRPREFPLHVAKYTEDEQALAERLKNPKRPKDSDDARVWHDVQAVAAVMTLRSGDRSERVSSAKYVFASGSSETVTNAARWYRETYPSGFEPIIHFRSLTNTAWLVKPGSAASVPMHQLVAACQAVLQPSAEVWSRFVRVLGDLVSSGEVSDDESIAVLASEFTHLRLADFEGDTDLEASTVREIVDRVDTARDSVLRTELDEAIRRRHESERAVVIAEGHTATVVSGVEAQVDRWAGAIAGTVYGSLCLALTIGGLGTLPMEWSQVVEGNGVGAVAWRVCVLAFLICTLLALFTDQLQFLNLFRLLKRRIAQGLRRRLLPTSETDDRAG